MHSEYLTKIRPLEVKKISRWTYLGEMMHNLGVIRPKKVARKATIKAFKERDILSIQDGRSA